MTNVERVIGAPQRRSHGPGAGHVGRICQSHHTSSQYTPRRTKHVVLCTCTCTTLVQPQLVHRISTLIPEIAYDGTTWLTLYSLTLDFQVDRRQRLRSSSTSALVVPLTRLSTIGDRAFPVAAARTWNSLPPEVTSSVCELVHICYFRHLELIILVHFGLMVYFRWQPSTVRQNFIHLCQSAAELLLFVQKFKIAVAAILNFIFV